MKKTISSILILLCLLLLTGCGARQRTIIFAEHLDDVAVTIDDKDYHLRDLAFYIAYQENNVQNQALVYDYNNANAFWNIYTNKNFLRIKTREEAMNMAIHDFIFLEMAKDIGLALSEEEFIYADSMMDDFWNDIGPDAQLRLGVDYDTLRDQIRDMALSQKYQSFYAIMNEREYEEYNMDGDAYKALLNTHTIKIKNNVWDGLNFGRITVNS